MAMTSLQLTSVKSSKLLSACLASGAAAVGTLALFIARPSVFFWLRRLVKRSVRLRDGTEVQPFQPPSWPLGNLTTLMSTPVVQVAKAALSKAAHQSGAVLCFFGPEPTLYIIDNDKALKELLGSKVTLNSDRNLGELMPISNRFPGEKSLFMLGGKEWKRIHSIAIRALGSKQIAGFVDLIASKVEEHFSKFEQAIKNPHGPMAGRLGITKVLACGTVLVDPALFWKEMALQVILAVAFGQELEPEDEEGFLHGFRMFEDSSAQPKFFLPGYLDSPFPDARKMRAALANMHSIGRKLAAKERAVQQDGNASECSSQTLLSALIRAQDDDGTKLTEEEVIHNVYGFIGTGVSTTSDTLNTTTFLLAQDPEVQNKLRAELKEVAGWDDMTGKAFVTAVITETVRLYPAVTGTAPRKMVEDTWLDDIFVPKGTNVMGWNMVMGRHEKVWGADVNEFRPERFDDQHVPSKARNATSNSYPMMPSPMPPGVPGTAFMAFGSGARPCVARPLAIVEMKLALLHLTKRFTVVENEPEKFEMTCGMPFLHPKRGLLIKFHANLNE
jgi:cytochrome P450